jgi:septum formation protein
VRVADVEELDRGLPDVIAIDNARRKAEAVGGELVLGVDTVVALGGAVYGKPGDEAQARQTLAALSGQTHQVVSGLALLRSGEVHTASAVTEVTFRRLSDRHIDWYVATEEWRERAGGYAIQGRGAALVRGISGDYLNVVGLPAATLLDLLGW